MVDALATGGAPTGFFDTWHNIVLVQREKPLFMEKFCSET